MKIKRSIQDRDIEVLMGRLLRNGVLLAAAIVVAGMVLYLYKYGHQLPEYTSFRSEPENLRRFGGILQGAWALHGRAVIQLGLLVLIATPILRIVFSVVGYLLEKDYLYVVITLIVLAIVSFSMLGNLAG